MAQQIREVQTLRTSTIPDLVRLAQLKRDLALLRSKLIRERGAVIFEPSGYEGGD